MAFLLFSKLLTRILSSLAALTQFQTNVFGVINVTNAVIPRMRERRSGTVVIVGSRSGWNPAMPVSFSSLTIFVDMTLTYTFF